MFTGSTNVHRRDEYTVQEIDRDLAETRRWVLVGHDSTNQAALLRQIEEAEKEKLTHYYLSYQDRGGGFYEIEYGLMKGSGSGKPA